MIVEVKMNRLPIDNTTNHDHYMIQNHKQIIKLRMDDKLRALRQLQQRMLTNILSKQIEVRVPSSHFNDSIESSTVSSLHPPIVTTRTSMSILPQHHDDSTTPVPPSSPMSNGLQALSSAIDILESQQEQLFITKQNLFSQITNDLLQSILEDQRMLQTADNISSIFIAHDDITVHGGFHDFRGISYNDRSVLPDNGSQQLLPNIQPLTNNASNNTRKGSSSISQSTDNNHIASHIFQCYDHDNHFGTAGHDNHRTKRHRIDEGENGEEEEIVQHQSGNNTTLSKNHGGFSSSALITLPNKSFQLAGLVGTKLLQQEMPIIPCNANRLPTTPASKKRRKEQGIRRDIFMPPLCATANVSNDSSLGANTSASTSCDSNALQSFLKNSGENRSETRTTRQSTTKKVKGMRTTKIVEKKKMEDNFFLSLGVEEDNSRLSPFLCFVRSECIEVFSATKQDMIERMKSKKVQIGQVGIRCQFCAHLQATDRAGRSSSFPTKLEGIYQCVQMMIYKHFPVCKEIPVETRKKYESLGRWTRKGDGDCRSYWIDAAKLKGMVNSGDSGIRMRPDSS